VLRAGLPRRAVGPAEHDGALELPAGHLPDLRRVVDDLVEGHGAEVPGHELDDGAQAHHGGAHADAREALSAMGVSTTRVAPKRSSSPSVTL
jgi:hypothetical protein